MMDCFLPAAVGYAYLPPRWGVARLRSLRPMACFIDGSPAPVKCPVLPLGSRSYCPRVWSLCVVSVVLGCGCFFIIVLLLTAFKKRVGARDGPDAPALKWTPAFGRSLLVEIPLPVSDGRLKSSIRTLRARELSVSWLHCRGIRRRGLSCS